MAPRRRLAVVVALLTALCSPGAGADPSLPGIWRLDPVAGTDIAPWRNRVLHLDIRDDGDAVTIIHEWRHRGYGSWTDSLTIVPGGEPVVRVVDSAVWPENWFMGVLAKVGSTRTTRATWLEPGARLWTETRQVVEVSQGEATILTTIEYAVEPGGDKLTLTERRSSRPTPVELVFDRVATEAGE